MDVLREHASTHGGVLSTMPSRGNPTTGENPVTIPQYLVLNASRFSDRPAMRHKDMGIWQSWSWQQVLEEICVYSLGLNELGLKPGDKVAIVGQNKPWLYWTFCAVQSLGGIPVPVYADSVAEEMAYVLKHAEIKYAVSQDQEQIGRASCRERV